MVQGAAAESTFLIETLAKFNLGCLLSSTITYHTVKDDWTHLEREMIKFFNIIRVAKKTLMK